MYNATFNSTFIFSSLSLSSGSDFFLPPPLLNSLPQLRLVLSARPSAPPLSPSSAKTLQLNFTTMGANSPTIITSPPSFESPLI
ncbi:hypothetical protein TorRG33x02_130340 [Trema orientale]|uniref:Uncharacterized protein n=1 Tax=Trema orientale TaxID=63057 RepID=A0A2P5F0A7_TREOI|nr:hypothetical protein TorRG33x02_130340 [Trema orientale]